MIVIYKFKLIFRWHKTAKIIPMIGARHKSFGVFSRIRIRIRNANRLERERERERKRKSEGDSESKREAERERERQFPSTYIARQTH